jgi:Transcriptional regulators, similar to M. xanthus CarD
MFVTTVGGVKVGFKVGQKVVYPNHGIGTIEQIEQKQIGAVALPFYTLRLAATNSLVLVPVSNANEWACDGPLLRVSATRSSRLYRAIRYAPE